jgi:hypothetical protein
MDHTENDVPHNYCECICCRGNVFAESLTSNGRVDTQTHSNVVPQEAIFTLNLFTECTCTDCKYNGVIKKNTGGRLIYETLLDVDPK